MRIATPLFALMIATPLAAQQAVPPPPPIVPFSHVPPIRSVKPSAGPVADGAMLQSWRAGEVTCDGARQGFASAPVPFSAMTWGTLNQDRPVSFTFRIDADGRPTDIARDGTAYVQNADSLAPALAASRFVAGAARQGCSIAFTALRTPVDRAPDEALAAYAMFPAGQPQNAVWDRLKPAGTTCFDPPAEALLRAYPAYKTIPQAPGTRGWTFVGYDIDAAGRPVHVRTDLTSGNAALDAAGRKAMAASRFEKGARTGCRYPFWRRGDPMTPPVSPDKMTFVVTGATCPRDFAWATRPPLRYPPNYNRAGVEGWAVIGFDTAPWGATGNAKVLASEPTEDFGKAALGLIAGATVARSATGWTGCVEKVVYRIRKPGEPIASDDAPPIIID